MCKIPTERRAREAKPSEFSSLSGRSNQPRLEKEERRTDDPNQTSSCSDGEEGRYMTNRAIAIRPEEREREREREREIDRFAVSG